MQWWKLGYSVMSSKLEWNTGEFLLFLEAKNCENSSFLIEDGFSLQQSFGIWNIISRKAHMPNHAMATLLNKATIYAHAAKFLMLWKWPSFLFFYFSGEWNLSEKKNKIEDFI